MKDPEDSCAASSSHGVAPKATLGTRIPAISAPTLALLASQHHNFMMLLLAFGLGDAAMSFMTAAPIVRNAMLVLSFAMIAVIAWQVRDPARPRAMRIMGAVSIAATVGFSTWSIIQFGW
jgi:hypothetical protein